MVGGPIYAPVGWTPLLNVSERRHVLGRLVESLREVAEYAASRGVTLAIEPLNRYETSIVNTVEQAREIVEAVDSPGCGILVDTFHINIEERDPAAAIRLAGDRLAHVQVCANDRGAPGIGPHRLERASHARSGEVGYGGPLCIESFTAENQTIARAAAIWRRLAPTQDAIATDGLAFLRSILSPAAHRETA